MPTECCLIDRYKYKKWILGVVLALVSTFLFFSWMSNEAMFDAIQALKTRNLDRFNDALSKMPNVNYSRGTTDRTLAHYLILEGGWSDMDFFSKALPLFIHKGGDINKKDVYGRTALHYSYIKNIPNEAKNIMMKNGAGEKILDKNNHPPDFYSKQ